MSLCSSWCATPVLQQKGEIEEAREARDRKDWAEAARLFMCAIQLVPEGPVLSNLLSDRAGAYLSLDRYEEALQDATKATELEPWKMRLLNLDDAAYSHCVLALLFLCINRKDRYADLIVLAKKAYDHVPDGEKVAKALRMVEDHAIGSVMRSGVGLEGAPQVKVPS